MVQCQKKSCEPVMRGDGRSLSLTSHTPGAHQACSAPVLCKLL